MYIYFAKKGLRMKEVIAKPENVVIGDYAT